jgi:hypothetical protein
MASGNSRATDARFPSLKRKLIISLVHSARLNGRDPYGPDKCCYASAGNGTAPHFAAELFKLSTGTKMFGIAYKGAAPAASDTIGGQAQRPTRTSRPGGCALLR